VAKAVDPRSPQTSPRASGRVAVVEDSTARQIAWWALLALVFVVPLAISNLSFLPGLQGKPPFTYDQFDIVKVFFQRFFALIALAAWSWHMLTKGGKLRQTPVQWLVLAFLGWVLITSFTSVSPLTAIFGKYRRFEGFISFVNYAVVFFLVLQLADNMQRIRTLAKSLFWSGSLVSLYGVMQYLGIDPITWGQLPFEARRAFSTYGNPDLLGGFLIFALGISLVLALSEDHLGWRAVYWGGFLITAWCWIVAFTRGAWIGGLVVLIVLAFAFIRQKVKLTSVDYGAMGITAAIAAAIVAISLRSTNEVMNAAKRVASIVAFNEGSSLTRFQIWQAAINAIKARPIFGFGADTFRLVFPAYKPEAYVAAAGYLSVADNVHDYPLQLAAGIGIPGLLLLYGLFGWVAWRTAPVAFAKRPTMDGLVLAGFWAVSAGYITHLMFGLSVTGSTFLLWVSMAALLSPSASAKELKAPSWGRIAALVIVGVAVVGIFFDGVYITADHYYLNARLGTPGSDQRVAAALEAKRLNPTNDMYWAEVGLAYQDQVINELTLALQQQQAGQDPTSAMNFARVKFVDAEQALKATIDFVPPEYDNYVFLANLYNLGGQYFGDPTLFDKAITVAKEGIKVERYGPAIRYQYAQALYRTDKTDQAISELKYAVKLDPRFADGSVLLATIYADTGNKAEAKKVLDAAVAAAGGTAPPSIAIAQQSLLTTETTP
jgi:O-antigen ligase